MVPSWMRRIHERFGFSESEAPGPGTSAGGPAPTAELASPDPTDETAARQNGGRASGPGAVGAQSSEEEPTASVGRSAAEVVHH